MFLRNLRMFISNALLVAFSGLLGIALLGVFFWVVYSQDLFPRALVASSGPIQSTFYADTFDRTEPLPYTAILGDSYGQGMGDAYTSNQDEYSVAHYLNANDGRNYLIFARSGYGSINAASELFRTIHWSRRSPFVPGLKKPEKILFFFYEGNDLNNNLDHLDDRGWRALDPEQLRAAIFSEIKDRTILSPRHRVNAWLPFYTLLSNIDRIVDTLVYQPYKRTKEENANPFPIAAELSEQMQFIAQNYALQSAAGELDEANMKQGIDVFLLALEALQSQVVDIPIKVVYIPSPVTSYDWGKSVNIETYHSSRKSLRISTQKNARNHAYIKAAIARGTADIGIELIDATPALRTAGRTRLLHGPVDTKHLNKEGYRVLSLVIRGAEQAQTRQAKW